MVFRTGYICTVCGYWVPDGTYHSHPISDDKNFNWGYVGDVNNSRTAISIYDLGWQCPECKTIYNPDVEKCECSVEVTEEETIFIPFEFILDEDEEEILHVRDNYTEDVYDVDAETIVDLLKQIHGL